MMVQLRVVGQQLVLSKRVELAEAAHAMHDPGVEPEHQVGRAILVVIGSARNVSHIGCSDLVLSVEDMVDSSWPCRTGAGCEVDTRPVGASQVAYGGCHVRTPTQAHIKAFS